MWSLLNEDPLENNPMEGARTDASCTKKKFNRPKRCINSLTCETVVHFRGLVVIVVVSRHYSDLLHVIVGLGALWGGLLGICITENYCPNDGLPWRLGGPIIVT